MKHLYLNIRYLLPNDFDGSINDAIEKMLEYRRSEKNHKDDFVFDPNKSVDDNWFDMVTTTDRVLFGKVGVFTLDQNSNSWVIDPIEDKEIAEVKTEVNHMKIIEVDDWLVIYLNGESIYQGHDLQGNKFKIWDLCIKHNVKRENVKAYWAEDVDIEDVTMSGCFPERMSELKGNYTDEKD